MLQEGRFGWCGRSGLALTDGVFWPRRAGGYNFYLSTQGRAGLNFNNPIAACGPSQVPISLIGLFAPSHDVWLAARTVSRFGLESDDYAWIRIRTDETGNGAAVPDPVTNLRAARTDWGTLKLLWEYQPRMGGVRPAEFRAYMGFTDDSIDYEFPLAQVRYREGLRSYAWNSDDFCCDYPIRIVVRAVTADGVDDGSKLTITTLTDLQSPGRAEDLSVVPA